MQTFKNGHTILVGEDEPEVRDYLETALKCLGYSVELAQDGDEVVNCLKVCGPNIKAVLLDVMMPNRDGINTLQEIRRMYPSLPVIIISGMSSTLDIVTAMKSGATDYLCKPVAHEDLHKAITKAFETLESTTPPRPLTTKTKAFLGSHPHVQKIHSLVAQIGWSEMPVLIQGETGTGKEVLARELHAHSPRAGKPFFKLNCAALPSELVESELFGYERGAFTGAVQKKLGMFDMAEGGTILLDEIGDMDIRLQAKLLQVLQDHEFRRIGGKDLVRVDVRIMGATHRDLEKAILNRTFREDLYYRLNVINLHLPPLRELKDDIVPLAEFLLRKHAIPGTPAPAITLDLLHAFKTYHWPGNIRELENVIRKFIVFRDPDLIARELHAKAARKPLTTGPSTVLPAHQPDAVPGPVQAAGAPILEQVTKAKQQAETEAILAALNSTRWNRKQAATLLKIDYKALLYKMKKLGIDDDKLISLPPEEAARAATPVPAGWS